MGRKTRSLYGGLFRRIIDIALSCMPLSVRNKYLVYAVIDRLQADVDGILSKKLECLLDGERVRICLREMTEEEARSLMSMQSDQPIFDRKLHDWLMEVDTEALHSFKVLDTLEEAAVWEMFRSENRNVRSLALSQGQIRFFVDHFWKLLGGKYKTTLFLMFSQNNLSVISIFYDREGLLTFNKWPLWDSDEWNDGVRIVAAQ